MTFPQSPNPIDADRAAAIFAEFAARADLVWGCSRDGCYARAHLMVKRLAEQGQQARKVWAFAASQSDLLWVAAPERPGGRVFWVYHVAPLLEVQGADSDTREVVIDPALFDRPASVEEWLVKLNDTPTVVRTRPGQPPIPAHGGSGYWPSPDPPEGPDRHAPETL